MIKLKRYVKVLPLTVLFFLAGCATLQHSHCSPSDYNDAPRDSFVKVHVEMPMGGASGSGAIIGHSNNHSLILTAAHVCHDESKFSIIDIDNKKHEAYVVRKGKVEVNDVCLLATHKKLNRPIIPVSLFAPLDGDPAYNLAAPYGIHDKDMVLMFHGHFSGKIKIGEDFGKLDVYTIPSAGGSSGSPIMNSDWEIVGVLSMGYRSFENIALSVPHEEIIGFLNPDFIDLQNNKNANPDYITPPMK